MKKSLFFTFAAMTMIVWISPVSADSSESQLEEPVTIAALIQYAYQENPSVRAARAAWRATVEKYPQITAYPDPQIMITYFPEPIETRLGPQDWNATISQMIPFPGKLSKAGEAVEADAQIARLNLDKTVRDITVSVLESFHELTYIREAKRIAAQNAELLDHLRKTGETAYAQDRANFTDVVKAQSQSAQLRYDALLLDELEQTEMTRLNGLLNRPPETSFGTLENIPFQPAVYSLEEIYALSESRQEEIRMAEAQVEKAAVQADLARYQNLPEFRVGIFYAAIGSPDVPTPPEDAGQDAVGIQFGVNVPLWFGKNTARTEQAQAELEKTKADKAARIIETRTKIRNLFFRLQNAMRLIQLYRDELLPQASASMELAETWFREGEGSFSDFTETQSALYNFQLSLARARADYGKYLAGLERLAGQNLTEK
jgi:outer membrane protein TolC